MMKKNKGVGAACGRIHPTGSGYMPMYQTFEYAVKSFFDKCAFFTHVLHRWAIGFRRPRSTSWAVSSAGRVISRRFYRSMVGLVLDRFLT